MSSPKRHHWIPQFYLRWFATPESLGSKNPRVYIFHRREGEPTQVAVSRIAVQKYLYSPFTDGSGRDFRREIDLAKLDGLLSRIWPALACDFVDLASRPVRQAISLFMATLFLRHPYTFARQRQGRRQLIKFVESAPKDIAGLPDIQWLEIGSDRTRVPFDKAKWRVFKNTCYNDEHWFFVDMIQAEAIEIAERLMRKRWSMVFMDEPLIVTSDNPFFVMDPDKKRHQILGEDAKLMFPVSPTRVLCFANLAEPDSQYYKVAGDQAGLYNFFTWVNTDDFLISPRNTDQVLLEIDDVRRHSEEEMRTERSGNSI
jgi:hypothetical protein